MCHIISLVTYVNASSKNPLIFIHFSIGFFFISYHVIDINIVGSYLNVMSIQVLLSESESLMNLPQ